MGDDGPTHHGVFDLSYLGQMPNIVIMAPKDENELQHMIYTALGQNGPAAVRYPRGAGRGVPLDKELQYLPVGKSELIRDGSDVALFAVGNMVEIAEKAAAVLEEQGISTAVVNARFVKPVDDEMVMKYAAKTGRIVTIEENVQHGGYGSSVLQIISGSGINGVKTTVMALPDAFAEHGDRHLLLAKYGLTVDDMVLTASKLMGLRDIKTPVRKSFKTGGKRLER